MTGTEPTHETAALFSRDALLRCVKYRERRDLLRVLLTEPRRYSLAEVEQRMADFLNRRVQ